MDRKGAEEKEILLGEFNEPVNHPLSLRKRSKWARYAAAAVQGLAVLILLQWTYSAIHHHFGHDRHHHRHRHHHHGHGHGHGQHHKGAKCPGQYKNPFSHAEAEEKFLAVPNNNSAYEWAKYYTSVPHMPGSDQGRQQAEWTREKWIEMGIADAEVVEYYPLLTFPHYHRVALFKGTTTDEVEFEARLTEDVIEEDPATHDANAILTHHGYSISGNVTAEIIYANYGYLSDFQALDKAGISVKGKIVLVKYGTVFRGLKVRAAEQYGAAGVLIYSDPQDDAIKATDGYDVYPNGPARQPSSVQRGSVGYLSLYAGDPLTPGYPATKDAKRVEAYNIPTIPSLPISYQDALPLLKAIEGNGPKASDFGKEWNGDLNLTYHIGPSKQKVNFVNDVERKISPIWNVIGSVPGRLSSEVIVIGNHRDAWNHGAGDPNSGSSALMEVIRGFSELMKEGWQPLRTIVIGSWDAEEIGLVGSTEWGEDRKDWLRRHAVAYLNVDVATTGDVFGAQSSPSLSDFVKSIASDIEDPKTGIALRESWLKTTQKTSPGLDEPEVGYLGSGSDFTVFLQHVGIAAVNIGFGPSKKSPIYHYHSNYDSLYWMAKFGDPGFHYHATTAKYWGLMTLRLASEHILPFNASRYASDLEKFVAGLEKKAEDAYQSDADNKPIKPLSFRHIKRAVNRYAAAAQSLDAAANKLRTEIEINGVHHGHGLIKRLRDINRRYRLLESGFIDEKGLEGRNWYKNYVFAPGLWTGYDFAAFPSLSEAIDDGKWRQASKVEKYLANLIYDAAEDLED